MAKTTSPLLPATTRLLEELGGRLRLARLRRRLQAKQVAERAGMSVMTLRAVEHGSAGVTIGAYAAVLQVLQLDKDIALLAATDTLGHRLQDATLSPVLKPRRPPQKITSKPAPEILSLTESMPNASGELTPDHLLLLLNNVSLKTG
ncbi:MAG: helix-turn-helix domain-containing protein [Methylophilaceae bacterium]